jgi:hypothetical protein
LSAAYEKLTAPMLVPATKVREVSHMLKAIYAQESRDAADRKARVIVDDLRAARMNTAADLVERSVSETLTNTPFRTFIGRRSAPTIHSSGS